MNDQSICSRWRAEGVDCAVGDALIDSSYFNPPTHNPDRPILSVLSFHAQYPQGRRFVRTSLGGNWVRES